MRIVCSVFVPCVRMAEKQPEKNLTSDSKVNKEEEASPPDATEDAASMLEKQLKTLSLFLQDEGSEEGGDNKEKPEKLLEEVTLQGVADFIKSNKCKNIITMSGAGVSTAAGIPDFRSPETGLYHNLEKYNLPNPQAIFDISYFKENPEPFFTLAKELYPGKFIPTKAHYFIKLLEMKGLLLRAYTQNIDTLERVAGISSEKIVEAHGTFHTSHCINCNKEYSQEWMKQQIFSKKDSIPICTDCKEGFVKPDIVFFGEPLPNRFAECVTDDFTNCDLLIILGTSLNVQPFASLCSRVSVTTPRLLINMEKAGECDPIMSLFGFGAGLDFSDKSYRDVFCEGTCDDGCEELSRLLGWKQDLNELVIPKETSSKI